MATSCLCLQAGGVCAKQGVIFLHAGCTYLINQKPALLQKSLSCTSSKAEVCTQPVPLPLPSALCTRHFGILSTQGSCSISCSCSQHILKSGTDKVRSFDTYKTQGLFNQRSKMHDIGWKQKRKGMGIINTLEARGMAKYKLLT